jgi:hypothetical protein
MLSRRPKDKTMPKCLPNRRGLYVPVLLACCIAVVAQEQPQARLEPLNPRHVGSNFEFNQPESSSISVNPEQIFSSFLIAEQRTREALNSYTFKRDVLLQTIGPNGEVTGEYIRNSLFVFDDRGNRIERVLFHPRSTIREMKITKEDIQDLAGAQLLGADINELGKYEISLLGRNTVEGRETYVIDVSPKRLPDPHRMGERFFVGQIWIDVASLQVFKVRGIVEPHGKQRFPIFETWREWSAGSLLFPARTMADHILHFSNRDVHYRVRVSYYDYKQFASTVKVTEVDQP